MRRSAAASWPNALVALPSSVQSCNVRLNQQAFVRAHGIAAWLLAMTSHVAARSPCRPQWHQCCWRHHSPIVRVRVAALLLLPPAGARTQRRLPAPLREHWRWRMAGMADTGAPCASAIAEALVPFGAPTASARHVTPTLTHARARNMTRRTRVCLQCVCVGTRAPDR